MKKQKSLKTTMARIIEGVAELLPVYLENEEDKAKSNGNVAICLIDAEGMVYGKVFGTDKVRGREAFRVAWMKASQVWITGIRTGEYERMVFSRELDESHSGIRKPDYIGWEGGQPIVLPGGEMISAGVSGLRGVSDLEIVVRAVAMVTGHPVDHELISIY